MKLRIQTILKSVVYIGLFFVLLVPSTSALAGSISPDQANFGLNTIDEGIALSNDVGIIQIVTNIINVVLGLLGIIVLGLILYAGFLWMTSNGNEEKIAKAKQILINAVIGLVIIMSAFAITRFVISSFSDATGSGVITDDGGGGGIDECTGSGCTFCNTGFSTVCLEQDFFVKSITPSTDGEDNNSATGMNNAIVRVLFSSSVRNADSTDAVRVVDQNNNAIEMSVQWSQDNKIVELTPSNGTFSNGKYTVKVNEDIKNTNDKSLKTKDIRNTVYPLETDFYINNTRNDNQNPTIDSLRVNDKTQNPVVYIGRNLTIEYRADDRKIVDYGGVSYSTIRIKQKNSANEVYTYISAPRVRSAGSGGSSVPSSVTYTQEILASDFSANKEYEAIITLHDIDGNTDTQSIDFSVYKKHCGNGIQDEDETAVDQGPSCGAEEGGSCTTSAQCSPHMECIEGMCVANPVITAVSPEDGAAPGNWVTIVGKYFGNERGTVEFGYPDDAGEYSNWIDASFPDEENPQCTNNLWHSTWTVVSIPEIENRDDIAIRITRAETDSDVEPASDTTLDGDGYGEFFEINDIERPGICKVVNTEGNPRGTAGSDITIIGQGFLQNSQIYWGNRFEDTKTFQNNKLLSSIVPEEFGNGMFGVRVENTVGENTIVSNGVLFEVFEEIDPADPVIASISPEEPTVGSYITLAGAGFGRPYGEVYIAEQSSDATACAKSGEATSECYQLKIELPSACGVTWRADEVVAEIRENIPAGGAIYAVALRTIDGKVSNNTETITINDGPAKPSICKLTPNSGPAPLPNGESLRLIGKVFGVTTGTVRFWKEGTSRIESSNWLVADDGNVNNQNTVSEIKLFTSQEVNTIFPIQSSGLTIPTGEPVPLVLRTAAGEESNAVSYSVNTCSEDSVQAGFLCCTTGPDAGRIKPAGGAACAGEVKSSGYTWRIASGLIPAIPFIKTQCNPVTTDVSGVMPSPSPSVDWSSGESSCINAQVVVAVNTPNGSTLVQNTINSDNIRMYACDEKGRDCNTENNFVTDPYAGGGSGDTSIIIRENDVDLDGDTWYRVELSTAIQTSETITVAGKEIEKLQNLAATKPCGEGTAYCFDFKTSEFGNRCTMVGAFVDPSQRTIRQLGPVYDSGERLTNFQVFGIANQACTTLSAQDIGWDWGIVDNQNDSVESVNGDKQIDINTLPSNRDDIRTLFTYSELPNAPFALTAATTTADEVTIVGSSTISIALGDPKVTMYWPNCSAACANATLGVMFNRNMMQKDFTTDNIAVYSCTDRACTNSTKITINIPDDFKTSRGLRITPKNPLLLNTWYKVVLEDNIHAIGGYSKNTDEELVELEGDSIETFEWGFKTKDSFDGCFINDIDIDPRGYIARAVGERNTYTALPYGTPDECSPYGQQLNPYGYDWDWSIPESPASYREVVDLTNTAIAIDSAPGCSDNCTPLGSDRVRTRAAEDAFICGNGAIDPGEACDIAMVGEVAGTGSENGITCTYSCQRPGNGSSGSGDVQCGNGDIDNPTNGRTAGEQCDDGNLNGTDESGCSSVCLLEGSRAEFDGNLSTPYCSISEEVFDGVIDAGEACEINSAGELVMVTSEGVETFTVNNPRAYCSNTCTFKGTELSQAWCDGSGMDTEACNQAVSICGNNILESGETCEITNIDEIAIKTGKSTSKTITVGEGKAASVCTPSCTLGNICEYKESFEEYGCDPEEEGCTEQCTLAGSSVNYTFLSMCRDNIVGTGEYAQCEVRAGDNQFTAPSQIATAKGLSTEVDPETQSQKSEIQVKPTRFTSGVDENGNPIIENYDASEQFTATSSYYLQCGYEEFEEPEVITETGSSDESIKYNGCPLSTNGFTKGVASNSCCYDRPKIATLYPEENSVGVCRNSLIEVTFDDIVIEKSSVNDNIILAKQITIPGKSCADSSLEDITEIVKATLGSSNSAIIASNIFERIWDGVKHFFASIIERVWAYDTDPNQININDGIWCDASIESNIETRYQPNAEGDSGKTAIRVLIRKLLDSNTNYAVLLRSGADGMTDDIAVPIQAKHNQTIYNGSAFQTGNKVCKIANIAVDPVEYMFRQPATSSIFTIDTITNSNEKIVPIQDVYDWRYDWAPKDSDLFIIPVTEDELTNIMPITGDALPGVFVSTTASTRLAARDIEAQQTAQARVNIIADIATDIGDQTGKIFTATTNLYARFCANIWDGNPDTNSINWAPYKDTEYNFEFWYCADAGSARVQTDDLPLLNDPRNIDERNIGETGPLPIDNIIKKNIFFNEDNNDAIGIQIFLNPNKQTARAWYQSNFGTVPESFEQIAIDGYDAITDGNTIYINAMNLSYQGEIVGNLYNNIYQFSINENATEKSRQVFAQIIGNLRFNTNVTDYGYCLQAGESNNRRDKTELFNGDLTCNTDFDCRTPAGEAKAETNGICSNNRTALFRDIDRLDDIALIQDKLERYAAADAVNEYPFLEGGTYYPGYTVTRWPSWGRLNQTLGGIPTDPINKWGTCSGVISDDINSQTCWNEADKQYHCPAFSSVYEYKVNAVTNEYTIHAPLEFLIEEDSYVNDKINRATYDSKPWCQGDTYDPFADRNCGDGIIQDGEECDPAGKVVSQSCSITNTTLGKEQSGKKSQVCSATCELPTDWDSVSCSAGSICGNGKVEDIEQCDAGDLNGEYGSGCSTECTIGDALYCGNGVLDYNDTGENYYEFCDKRADGMCLKVINGEITEQENGCNLYAILESNTCNASCAGTGEYCGDSIVQSEQGEICDDGNTVDGDGCSSLCKVEEASNDEPGESNTGICGDGIVQNPNKDGVKESCDLAADNGIRPDALYGESRSYCSADCKTTLTVDSAGFCGDGEVQDEFEVCDVNNAGQVLGRQKNENGEFIGNVGALSCNDVGAYECTNSCQTIVDSCAQCIIHEGTENERSKLGAIAEIAVLNPLIAGNDNYKDLEQSREKTVYDDGETIINYTYWGGNIESGTKESLSDKTIVSILRDTNRLSWSKFAGKSNDNRYPWTFGSIINTDNQKFDTIETSLSCKDEYSIIFSPVSLYRAINSNIPTSKGYNENNSINELLNTNRADIFPYSVNGESSRVRNSIVASPAVPKNAIRIIVSWPKLDIGTTLSGNIYSTLFSGGSNASGSRISLTSAKEDSIPAAYNYICNNMVRDGLKVVRENNTIATKDYLFDVDDDSQMLPSFIKSYWWPKTKGLNSCRGYLNDKIFVHDVGSVEDKSLNIQSMTIDLDALYNLNFEATIPFYVSAIVGSNQALQAYQKENITVSIYEYHENQVPGYSLYQPTEIFTLNKAEYSSNTNANFWHTFNIKIANGGVTFENFSENENGKVITRIADIEKYESYSSPSLGDDFLLDGEEVIWPN